MSNLLKAAASYYGLADTNVVDSELVSQAGTYITFRIAVSDEDLYGVLARMKAMQEQAPAEAPSEPVALPSRDRMRDEYNAMSARDRSPFGSFARYEAWRLGQAMDEVVAGGLTAEQHFERYATDDERALNEADNAAAGIAARMSGPVEKVELPPYVYLSPAECTQQQKAMAVGMDEKGNYAVPVEDLTEEQHVAHVNEPVRRANAEVYAGYVKRTVDRLTGADGKPTSNASDFGGLPG